MTVKKCISIVFLLAIILSFSACDRNGDEAAYININDSALPGHNISPMPDSGQVEQAVQETAPGIFRQFDNLGFSIEFPPFWEGKYGTEETSFQQDYGTTHLVAIYHLGSTEFGGVLLRLGRAAGEQFTYDNPPLPAGGSIILAQADGYTYFINFPSDVQYNYLEPNSESALEYQKMTDPWPWSGPSHWDFLIDSFRLLD